MSKHFKFWMTRLIKDTLFWWLFPPSKPLRQRIQHTINAISSLNIIVIVCETYSEHHQPHPTVSILLQYYHHHLWMDEVLLHLPNPLRIDQLKKNMQNNGIFLLILKTWLDIFGKKMSEFFNNKTLDLTIINLLLFLLRKGLSTLAI